MRTLVHLWWIIVVFGMVAGFIVSLYVCWVGHQESRNDQPWDEWSHREGDTLVITDEPCCEPDYSYDLGRYVHTGKNCRDADYEYLRKEREWNS